MIRNFFSGNKNNIWLYSIKEYMKNFSILLYSILFHSVLFLFVTVSWFTWVFPVDHHSIYKATWKRLRWAHLTAGLGTGLVESPLCFVAAQGLLRPWRSGPILSSTTIVGSAALMLNPQNHIAADTWHFLGEPVQMCFLRLSCAFSIYTTGRLWAAAMQLCIWCSLLCRLANTLCIRDQINKRRVIYSSS